MRVCLSQHNRQLPVEYDLIRSVLILSCILYHVVSYVLLIFPARFQRTTLSFPALFVQHVKRGRTLT